MLGGKNLILGPGILAQDLTQNVLIPDPGFIVRIGEHLANSYSELDQNMVCGSLPNPVQEYNIIKCSSTIQGRYLSINSDGIQNYMFAYEVFPILE